MSGRHQCGQSQSQSESVDGETARSDRKGGVGEAQGDHAQPEPWHCVEEGERQGGEVQEA